MELNKVHLGNCLEVMKTLEDNSIDLIVTDPPFLHIKGGMKSKRVNTGSYKPESYVNTEMRDFDEVQIYEFLNLSKKVFKGSFNGYFFCSKLQILSYLKWVKENKLNSDLLIWDRLKNSMISTKFYTSNIDYIIRIYGKHRALNKILNEAGKGDVSYYKKIQSYKHPREFGHETEKPIELISKYIALSSNEGDTILDPFAGSGTTGVACKNLNRNFILIEKEQEYCNIAESRIKACQAQTRANI